jgi:hypothetical protein
VRWLWCTHLEHRPGRKPRVRRQRHPTLPAHRDRSAARRRGSRVFYLAHHGDTWVPTPFLASYRLGPNGAIDEIARIEDPAI